MVVLLTRPRSVSRPEPSLRQITSNPSERTVYDAAISPDGKYLAYADPTGTYLRVIADGKSVFDGRVTPGTAYPFEAGTQIEILAGNGAALRLTFNLRDMGLLGGYGEVINLIYRADGVITPTPTVGPTPTITATPSITPSPTQTPTTIRTLAP